MKVVVYVCACMVHAVCMCVGGVCPTLGLCFCVAWRGSRSLSLSQSPPMHDALSGRGRWLGFAHSNPLAFFFFLPPLRLTLLPGFDWIVAGRLGGNVSAPSVSPRIHAHRHARSPTFTRRNWSTSDDSVTLGDLKLTSKYHSRVAVACHAHAFFLPPVPEGERGRLTDCPLLLLYAVGRGDCSLRALPLAATKKRPSPDGVAAGNGRESGHTS